MIRSVNFAIQLLIACSLLVALSWFLAEPAINAADLTGDNAWGTPARSAISGDTVIDRPEIADDTSAADAGLTDSEAAALPEPLSLNDPYSDQQWALRQIQVTELWPAVPSSPEILVAVLDTGIDRTHEDLEGKVVASTNLTDSLADGDVNGHGTHVAGIIAAEANNGLGIAGVAPQSRLIDIKVANDKGQCQTSAVARGIIWAVDHGADVINLSVRLGEPSAELEAAVNYAWSRGAVLVAAAGNEGNQQPVYPACYDNCIAVAATDQDDDLMVLSNYGDWVDVAAPGLNIYSTLPGGSYGYKSGTSFATAQVSGLAALLFGLAPDIDGNGRVNDEVRDMIEAGCQALDIDGVGWGRIAADTVY